MKTQEIIEYLKQHYNRDLRKQIVKSVLNHEKSDDQEALRASYNILNQIFSFVLSELGWSIVEKSNDWDDQPLEILKQTFPKLENTQWYKEQELHITQSIKLESNMLQ